MANICLRARIPHAFPRIAPSLPTEIIQLILYELHPNETEAVAIALTVSSISRHWRAVALSTPSLWSTFSFRVRTHREAMLPAFFERSIPAPLRIAISFDFTTEAQLRATKVQRALTLLRREADRVEQLHLQFFDRAPLGAGILAQTIGLRSSTLRHLELEALHGDDDEDIDSRELLLARCVKLFTPKCWSVRCPALTHITTTDPEMLIYCPAKITSLCLKGVPGRRHALEFSYLRELLDETKALTDLVIDGVSLQRVIGGRISLPHLRALSLRSSPFAFSIDALHFASLFVLLETRGALTSLTVRQPDTQLPLLCQQLSVCRPSVTRFAFVPDSSPLLFYYPTALPNVEELVLLGSDPKLYGIAGLSGVAWPRLRTIDLRELEPPPPEYEQMLCERLYWYGHRRCEAGHDARLLVWLPCGVVPRDITPDAGEFMDLRVAY